MTDYDECDYHECFDRIMCLLEGKGKYWNNVVGFTLAKVAQEQEASYANQLIKECGLESMVGEPIISLLVLCF